MTLSGQKNHYKGNKHQSSWNYVKFVLLLVLIGMIVPVFAQEPSFDEQLVISEEYTKIADRLQGLENQGSELIYEFQNLENSIIAKLSEINYSLIQTGDVANRSLWLGLYVSIIFASIAIFATIWNAIKIRDQTNKIEEDVNARIRPIIGRKHVDVNRFNYKSNHIGEPTRVVINVNGGTYSFNHEKMMIHLTNTGILPALYLKKKSYFEIRNDVPKNYLPKFSNQDKKNAVKFHALGPNEFYSVDIEYPKDEQDYFKLSRSTDTIYFGLIVWYEDKHEHKGKEYFYQIEGHIDHDALMLDYMNMN